MSWLAILRLGLVQAAIGCVVVLVVSTLNRVMVVEYSLPALLPGCLIALHYLVQILRPRFGFGSDLGGRRTSWIVGGMTLLCVGGMVCAYAAGTLGGPLLRGIYLSLAGYILVGLGVGASGTNLLALLASQVDPCRRAPAAAIMWILMIAGFAVTSSVVGHFLDPFSPARLLRVAGATVAIAWVIAVSSLWGVEQRGAAAPTVAAPAAGRARFIDALRSAWLEPRSRRFTLFVFVSMLAYSALELLLEPYGGLVFGYSVGESAQLSGSWHAAVLLGMIVVGVAAGGGGRRFGALRRWTGVGCVASAVAISSLAVGAFVGVGWPLRASVLLLGVANGVFTLSAIASMMELANEGPAPLAGMRMGLWGASQALAFAAGGLAGTAIVDGVRWWVGSAATAFGVVFVLQAALFIAAARLAALVDASTLGNFTLRRSSYEAT